MWYKLSDLFDLQMGKTPSRNNPNYWNSKDYLWVSISDMSGYDKYVSSTKEYISERAVKESGIKTIPANTVIMSFKLSIGKTAITTESIFSNEAIMAFIDKKTTTIDPEYIFYLFSGKDWDEGSNKAVMGKTLNKATLSNTEVDIPSLDIQKERVDKLNKISTLIADKKQQLNQLDELVKARFVEMFGCGYEEVELSELGKISTGSTPSMKNKDFYENTDTPFYKPGDFIDGVSNIDCSESFIDARAESISKIMNPGTVAVTCIGIIGKIGIIKRRGICNQQINFITPNDNVNSTYLAYAIDTKKRFMQEKANVPVVPILNKTNFSKVTIPFAPVKLQNQFATFVAQVDKSKFAVQKSLEKTQLLFNSLMQEYFG